VARRTGAAGPTTVFTGRRFGDLFAEIDVRVIPPTDGAYVMLGVRRQPDGDHYRFVLSTNTRSFLLERWVGNRSTHLIDWTDAPAINGGPERNRLGIWAQGPNLVLLINDQEVGWARDDAFSEGTVSFGVGHFQDGDAEARFSNLVVTAVE
jgi:hypothetical protein